MYSDKNIFLHLIKVSLRQIWLPLSLMIGTTLMLVSIHYATSFWSLRWHLKMIDTIFFLTHLVIVSNLYWMMVRVLNATVPTLQIYLKQHRYPVSSLMIHFISNALKIFILFSVIAFIIDYLPVPSRYTYLINRLLSILMIGTVAWISIRLVMVTEQFIALKFNIDNTEDVLARKTHTQLIILKRIVIGLILMIALGAIFFSFDTVRELGASILASAGIAGIVAGFAAQKSLNNLIISLQIALNQPIKINDFIFIEETFGQIEEITTYYVVLKAWDLRRVIIPIHYFLEKSFQNLSRYSTDLLGTIKLYVDYTLPLMAAREELALIMARSLIWDKKFYNLQVTDAKETTIELRILVSAVNPANEWDLRCEVREAFISFIQQNYPQCLPQTRFSLSQAGLPTQ